MAAALAGTTAHVVGMVGGVLWALFALWFAASRYERAHREYSFLTGLLWTVVLLMIMTQTLRDQRQSPRSRRLLSVLFAALAAVNIGLIWRGLDTDLRYCIGQTYYQKTPIDSFGCDIVKAIPQPRFEAVVNCGPTANGKPECRTGRWLSFESYNQRQGRFQEILNKRQ